jgi:hypothetical protein
MASPVAREVSEYVGDDRTQTARAPPHRRRMRRATDERRLEARGGCERLRGCGGGLRTRPAEEGVEFALELREWREPTSNSRVKRYSGDTVKQGEEWREG